MGGRRSGRAMGGLWAAHLRKQVFEKKMFANGGLSIDMGSGANVNKVGV